MNQDKWSIDDYPTDKYEPIGVVVVPSNHNVYGDGSCGVMSLKEMSCGTPDDGSNLGGDDNIGMTWGQKGNGILLNKGMMVPYVGKGSDVGDASSTVIGQNRDGNLPSDDNDDIQCPHDIDVYYVNNNTYYQVPSPYLTDGSRNPAYYQTTSPSSSSNALADFDGIGNSQVMWDLATAQSDWKTASSITNNTGSGYSPAACCCWRYHTNGTKQGDWYLPACGELGYKVISIRKINNSIANLLNAYGDSFGIKLTTYMYYWSSTECDSTQARAIAASSHVANIDKGNTYYFTRAFLRVNSNGKIFR